MENICLVWTLGALLGYQLSAQFCNQSQSSSETQLIRLVVQFPVNGVNFWIKPHFSLQYKALFKGTLSKPWKARKILNSNSRSTGTQSLKVGVESPVFSKMDTPLKKLVWVLRFLMGNSLQKRLLIWMKGNGQSRILKKVFCIAFCFSFLFFRGKKLPEGKVLPCFYCGVSSVIHPRNPKIPTLHFNYRWDITLMIVED